jgi:hypothetical protein
LPETRVIAAVIYTPPGRISIYGLRIAVKNQAILPGCLINAQNNTP